VKDAKQEKLEACRPDKSVPPLEGVDHCLTKLYADKQHKCLDEICSDLTYEEVIGTLLQARDIITTGQVAKRRGRKYFRGHIIKFLDNDRKVVGKPYKTADP
jgi:hypothetical protein